LDLEPLCGILDSMAGAGQTDLIPLLQEIQSAYGYLPKPVLTEMSRRTGIEAARIYGVATFYEQFYLEPHGRHTMSRTGGTRSVAAEARPATSRAAPESRRR